jgi:hypothetical protein
LTPQERVLVLLYATRPHLVPFTDPRYLASWVTALTPAQLLSPSPVTAYLLVQALASTDVTIRLHLLIHPPVVCPLCWETTRIAHPAFALPAYPARCSSRGCAIHSLIQEGHQ